MATNYITDTEFKSFLKSLGYDPAETPEDEGISPEDMATLLEEAVADLETKLSVKYVVPLLAKSGQPYSVAPSFARVKVKSALKSCVRRRLANWLGRCHEADTFREHSKLLKELKDEDIKDLLDPKKVFGFQLLSYAEDANQPQSYMGLARPDTEYNTGW